jgi:hypothetical protein
VYPGVYASVIGFVPSVGGSLLCMVRSFVSK